jgi:hypothetical protein
MQVAAGPLMLLLLLLLLCNFNSSSVLCGANTVVGPVTLAVLLWCGLLCLCFAITDSQLPPASHHTLGSTSKACCDCITSKQRTQQMQSLNFKSDECCNESGDHDPTFAQAMLLLIAVR